MSKYNKFGMIAREIYLSEKNISIPETLRILKEEHGCEIDIRTLKRWKKADEWEEDRLRKYFTTQQLKELLRDKQLEHLIIK